MTIDKDTVKHVATLARLELTDAEVEQYSRDLGNILKLVEQLNELDLGKGGGKGGGQIVSSKAKIKPQNIKLDEPTLFREDRVERLLERETLLKNAPHEEEGFFRVPQILDTSDDTKTKGRE